MNLGPWSITALLATLVLLFAVHDQAIAAQPLVFEVLAMPLLIQALFNAGLACRLHRQRGKTLAGGLPCSPERLRQLRRYACGQAES